VKQSCPTSTFPALLQHFFVQGLIAQRNASTQTVASYRDTFRLLLTFAKDHVGKAPAKLGMEDFDEPLVTAFLDHLEVQRKNSIRTRNVRLAAIRSFVNHVSSRAPAALPAFHRVLGIPFKRFDKPMLGFLSREEVDAIIAAPDRNTWSGRRDHALFSTFYNTGARVSELIGLRQSDVHLARGPHVRLHGKGRKERSVPLWKSSTAILADWFREIGPTSEFVFPNRHREPLSRSGVERRLRPAVRAATECCPTLRGRRISPHTFRHTTAMHLLQSGVDLATIALWLGHESTETTDQYLEANLEMKRTALAKMPEPSARRRRYQPTEDELAFLEKL
jgi:site-specific recombinase XerD